MQEAPRQMRQVGRELSELVKPVHEANRVAEDIARQASSGDGRKVEVVRTVPDDPYALLTRAPKAVGGVLAVVLLTFFFMVFGGLVMTPGVQQAWTGQETVHALPVLTHFSVELVQVSVFLAAFSGLYFAVGVITDETYREQFFSAVLAELERAVGVRAAYLVLREEPDRDRDGVD